MIREPLRGICKKMLVANKQQSKMTFYGGKVRPKNRVILESLFDFKSLTHNSKLVKNFEFRTLKSERRLW
jgi:hypothetical protein